MMHDYIRALSLPTQLEDCTLVFCCAFVPNATSPVVLLKNMFRIAPPPKKPISISPPTGNLKSTKF